jgi:hypothetical protein
MGVESLAAGVSARDTETMQTTVSRTEREQASQGSEVDMSAAHCLACEHDNTPGAKFCSECGAQLNLKLCRHCEAINERAWQQCHNCGTEFPSESVANVSRELEVSPGKALAAERYGKNSRLAVPALLLAAITAFAYYIYRGPTAGPNDVDLGRSASSQPNIAGMPATSVTPPAGNIGTAEMPTAKAAASPRSVMTSQQRAPQSKAAAKSAKASSSNKKRAPNITAEESALSGSKAPTTDTAAVVPRSSIDKTLTATPVAASAKVRLTKHAGSPRPVSADDFQAIAPPP